MKSKRDYLFLGVLVVVLCSVSLVAAACPGGSKDLMMLLSSSTNAHAALYNGSYTTEICYSNVFGQSYTDAEIHTCFANKSNSVGLFLSADTNAHARTSNSPPYTREVCFGDGNLNCQFETGSCTGGRSPVVALSSTSNAHLATSAGGSYNNVLCCKVAPSAGGPDGPFWEDSNGNPTMKIRVTETVKAVIPNYPADTLNDVFNILERDTNPPLNWLDEVRVNKQLGSQNGFDYEYSWTPTMTDINAVNDVFDTSILEFYFQLENNGVNILDLEPTGPYLDVSWCGDSTTDTELNQTTNNPFESCDLGSSNGNVCTPVYAYQDGAGASCQWCNSTCSLITVPQPYCGDGWSYNTTFGYPTDEEGCDDGAGNALTCDAGGGPCSFCSSQTCTWQTIDNSKVYFTNLQYGKITQANPGDTVIAFWPFGGSRTDKFLIYEEDRSDSGVDDPDYPPLGFPINPPYDDVVYQAAGETDANGHYFLKWTIDDGNMSAGNETGNEPELNFHFDVLNKITAPADKLVVKEPTFGSGDDPLDLTLNSPACGTEIFVGDTLTINFTALDTDDLIDIELEIDGIMVSGYPKTDQPGGTLVIPYTFNSPGTANIRVYAKNDRGDEASLVSNVIVIDNSPGANEKYVAACISEPKNFEHITSDFARFNASGTVAIQYDMNQAPGSERSVIPKSSLSFVWTFSDGTTNPYTDSRSYEFIKYFQQKGDNWAQLDVTLL